MKIYFQNRAAKLKLGSSERACSRCPFKNTNCPWSTSTIIDCYHKGWWVDGESIDVFKL